jgi:hypothetical protein
MIDWPTAFSTASQAIKLANELRLIDKEVSQADSSSAPLSGSTAAAAWQRIGNASTERRWRSCASPQSASCSENSAIQPEVSGQTLRYHL